MNKILLLLLVPIFCFSQTGNNSNWSKKSNTIYWEKSFDSDPTKAAKFFSENVKIPNTNKGIIVNQKMKCPNGSIYAKTLFNYNYVIKYAATGYTVQVSEIVFQNSTQVSVAGVTTSNQFTRIEDYELRTKDGEFRKNSLSKTTTKCLDEYLTETFTVE